MARQSVKCGFDAVPEVPGVFHMIEYDKENAGAFNDKKQTCSVFLLSLCGKGRIMLPFTQIYYHENLV